KRLRVVGVHGSLPPSTPAVPALHDPGSTAQATVRVLLGARGDDPGSRTVWQTQEETAYRTTHIKHCPSPRDKEDERADDTQDRSLPTPAHSPARAGPGGCRAPLSCAAVVRRCRAPLSCAAVVRRCRELDNAALQERREAWQKGGVSVTRAGQ